ncbi:hypothetical protein [Holospora curviuscula]|uniref:Uncharacterized protein n=1 Tax=Holospora curviuscula TaxID=1082868 RepID=A0A2S5R8N7_9PROT|nr:hypothetical protein [Holospora curviuscula]PPE03701.1 hypothetical protein HCUR_00840 [Holospora curviuscula]
MIALSYKLKLIFLILFSVLHSVELKAVNESDKIKVADEPGSQNESSTYVSPQTGISDIFSSDISVQQQSVKSFVAEILEGKIRSVWKFCPDSTRREKINSLVSENKKNFLRLIQYARVHNVPLNEAEGVQGIGIKAKGTNGVRFITPFTSQGINTAIELMGVEGDEVSSFRTSLLEFYRATKKILQEVGLYPKNIVHKPVALDIFEEEQSDLSLDDKESLMQINKFLHKRFNIFKSCGGFGNIEVQCRFVTGSARHQKLHIDGNTLFVISFGISGVYMQYSGTKIFLPKGENLGWFGEKAQFLLDHSDNGSVSKMLKQLEDSGIDRAYIEALPHGVEYDENDEESKNSVALLLIFVLNNCSSYSFWSKPVEEFQKLVPDQEEKVMIGGKGHDSERR